MAKFERLIGARTGEEVYVNVDQVTYISRSHRDEGQPDDDLTFIHFASDHGVQVNGAPEDVMDIIGVADQAPSG